MKLKVLALAAVSILGIASAAHADEYGPGPRPPYATGAYIGLGLGSPDCSFTLLGAQGGVTVLGISLGGGARLGLGGGCREHSRDAAPYAPPPPPASYGGGYPAPAYQTQGGYQGGYQNGYAVPSYQQGGYPAPQPCPCQAQVAYRPY